MLVGLLGLLVEEVCGGVVEEDRVAPDCDVWNVVGVADVD